MERSRSRSESLFSNAVKNASAAFVPDAFSEPEELDIAVETVLLMVLERSGMASEVVFIALEATYSAAPITCPLPSVIPLARPSS